MGRPAAELRWRCCARACISCIALALLCLPAASASNPDSDSKPSNDVWSVQINFYQFEIGTSIVRIDGKGNATFKTWGQELYSTSLDADCADKMLELAIQAHGRFHNPTQNKTVNNTTGIQLEVLRPGEKPLRFKGTSFIYRDELPDEFAKLVKSLNEHAPKESQLNLNNYLDVRRDRRPPAAHAESKPAVAGPAWSIKVEFQQHEMGVKVLTLDGLGQIRTGKARRPIRNEVTFADAGSMEKDDAQQVLDLALQAHGKLRDPTEPKHISDPVYVTLEINRPGQKPLKFRGLNFLYDDQIPDELTKLFEAINEHVPKDLRWDPGRFLSDKKYRPKPRGQ